MNILKICNQALQEEILKESKTKNSIQVCSYIGEWPNHTELDCDFVNTKQEAIDYIKRNRGKERAKGEFYNYRIYDCLNRFPTMFFEFEEILAYTHKA